MTQYLMFIVALYAHAMRPRFFRRMWTTWTINLPPRYFLGIVGFVFNYTLKLSFATVVQGLSHMCCTSIASHNFSAVLASRQLFTVDSNTDILQLHPLFANCLTSAILQLRGNRTAACVITLLSKLLGGLTVIGCLNHNVLISLHASHNYGFSQLSSNL